MARGHKVYRPGGLVTAVSPALVPAEKAIDTQNMCYRPDGSFGSRIGTRARLEFGQYFQCIGDTTIYNSTGTGVNKLFEISDRSKTIESANSSVAYANPSGAGDTFYITSTGTLITYTVTNGGVVVTTANYDLLTGFEAAPVTLADLKTRLETVAGVTVTIPATLSGTEPAAFILDRIDVLVPAGSSRTAKYRYLSTVSFMSGDTGTNTSFQNSSVQSGYLAGLGRTKIKPSWTTVGKRIFFTNGYGINVLDGQNVLPAGVSPMPGYILTPVAAAGALATGAYRYLYTFSKINALGQEVESNPLETTAVNVVLGDVVISTVFGS